MKLHATMHSNHAIDNASLKKEIEAIKTYFAVKSDLVKWTVGVGAVSVATILSILISMLASIDARITHLDTRLSQEILEIRKEMREDRQEIRTELQAMRQESRTEQQEMRQEMRQTFKALSNKIDTLRR